MLRQRRSKHRKDESEKDSLPLLEKMRWRKKYGDLSSSIEKDSQWDNGSIVVTENADREDESSPLKSTEKKKLMIKMKMKSSIKGRQPLIAMQKIPDRIPSPVVNLSFNSSEFSVNNENQISQQDTRMTYPGKRKEREKNTKLKSFLAKNGKNCANNEQEFGWNSFRSSASQTKSKSKDSEDGSFSTSLFTDSGSHSFHDSGQNNSWETIPDPSDCFSVSQHANDENVNSGSHSFYDSGQDKSWETIPDPSDCFSVSQHANDENVNIKVGMTYHDHISEAVALRLKQNKIKRKKDKVTDNPQPMKSEETNAYAIGNHTKRVNFDDYSTLDDYLKLKGRALSEDKLRDKRDNETPVASKLDLDLRVKTNYQMHQETRLNTDTTTGKKVGKPVRLPISHQEKKVVSRAKNKLTTDVLVKKSSSGDDQDELAQDLHSKIHKERESHTCLQYDHEVGNNSIVSICLLNLNGEKANASTRLKAGLITSGRQNSSSDKEYLARMGCTDDYGYVVLENMSSAEKGEDIQLEKAMVPISKNTDESKRFQSNNTSRDVRTQTTTLLMVRYL